MTPLQAAKALCANYQPDQSCLAIALRDDLSMYRFRKEGLPCLLKTCEACPYFEQTVLPQVPASIAEEYRKSLPPGANTTVRPQAIKPCADCGRQEVNPRQTYCPNCARKRKQASDRKHIRAKRELGVGKRGRVSPSESTPQNAQKVVAATYIAGTLKTASSFPTCKSLDTGS